MSKIIEKKQLLRTKIKESVKELTEVVGSTMGPKGRNVLVQYKNKKPFISKDGVTIAQAVNFDDPVKNAVAEIVKQASENTVQSCGDGTTTSTILVNSIIKAADKYIAAGSNPTDLKRGIDKALAVVKTYIEQASKPIEKLEEIEHIATISANGDKNIGKLLSLAVDKVGRDGAITIEDSKTAETSLDIVEGFQIDSGFFSPQFITDERKMSMRYDNPLLLITNNIIDNVDDMLPALELASRSKKPLIIVAESIEGQALAALILNAVKGTMKVGAIKAPYFGEQRTNTLEDLAIAVGATYFNQYSDKKLTDVKMSDFGTCKTVESMKNWSTFVNGNGKLENIEKRIEQIKVEIQNTKNLNEAEILQDRITKLTSGVAIIKVGGLTEVEMIERKHRIEDALEAVKSAQEEGILIGGGITLLRIAKLAPKVEVDNEDQELGVKILYKALESPFRQISTNAELTPDVLINKLDLSDIKLNSGFNFATENYVDDMFIEGIIDPSKVTRCALENAVSVASVLLTTDFSIIEN